MSTVNALWSRVERDGVQSLTNAELRALNAWCEMEEVCLPPAQWITEELAKRQG